jgi:hypothetical protein
MSIINDKRARLVKQALAAFACDLEYASRLVSSSKDSIRSTGSLAWGSPPRFVETSPWPHTRRSRHS